jgi:hypothetical protein
MSRRRRSAMTRSLGGAAGIALSALVSAQAETVSPDRISYDVKVNEDPATKACLLGFAVKDDAAGETVMFRLVVARMKRDDTPAGPPIFGFTIAVHDLHPGPRRKRLRSRSPRRRSPRSAIRRPRVPGPRRSPTAAGSPRPSIRPRATRWSMRRSRENSGLPTRARARSRPAPTRSRQRRRSRCCGGSTAASRACRRSSEGPLEF